MLLGAYMVTGYTIASVYAVGMLRGRRDRHHRFGLLIPLTLAAVMTPIQIGVGDWIAGTVAEEQPIKLAAMEGLFRTSSDVPLSLGGLYYDNELHYAFRLPYGLSLLVHHNLHGVIPGLDRAPVSLRPPVNVVHLSYNVMVGLGSALLLLALVFGWVWWRRRAIPRSRWFLRAVAVSGVAAVAALETGWVTTEVGRQPWTVYGLLRTADAVSPAPGLYLGLLGVLAVYAVLTVLTVVVLRRLAHHRDTPAPQEVEAEPPDRHTEEVAVR
jgi:cytochrome d ubiquinol oxidase subunit I